MDTRILLEGFKDKKSSNTSEGLNIQLQGRKKLLPYDDVAKVISQYDQYVEERESCNIIRLTCQVNPICSNVLFNRITEVVKDEGTDKVSHLNYGINGIEDDDKLFDGVKYKDKTMDAWSISGTIRYDSSINSKDIPDNTPIFSASNNYMPAGTAQSGSGPNFIRDTQLSNIGFVYHCGLDILNNHLIRSNTFRTVCRMKNRPDDYTAFNTIADLMRDVNGYQIIEKVYFPSTVSPNVKTVPLHLYGVDDIYSFDDSIKNNLKVKNDGWVGFNNKSKIKSYEVFSASTELEIERPIMYLNGGDFVDMYPGRDLYSFIPKYNDKRHRIEKNWNYCLTYPSSSYTPSDNDAPFSDIIESNEGINSMKTIYFDENTRADNGVSQLVMYSIAKHGLSVGDYVNIYNTYDSGENTINELVIENAEVNAIVDDFIFTVFNSTTKISNKWVTLTEDDLKSTSGITIDGIDYIMDQSGGYFIKKDDSTPRDGHHYYLINNQYVNFDDNAQRVSYKKVVNGIECDYYIRIFSKIPNFKYASGDTSSEYEIYKDNGKIIEEYQDHKYDFESHVSRLAFAKNIYSDNIGEVVFNDDIDISNLHDNLGRPLTSIYLTFVKNNKGYKEWYGYDIQGWNASDNFLSNETVEYSHAFGSVTYGIKTCEESRFDNDINSINKINNGGYTPNGYYVDEVLNGGFNRSYKIIHNDNEVEVPIANNEIWFDQDKHYYGDLCYYDNYNAIERHIDYVMHRFNTAQRESSTSSSEEYFSKLYYDDILYDDYDTDKSFSIKTNNVDFQNSKNEGYYYNPHYEIPIRTFGTLQTMFPDFLTMRQLKMVGNYTYEITTLKQHFLGIGDKAVIYDSVNDKYYDLVAISGSNDNYRVFTCKVYDEKTGKETNIGDITTLTMSNDTGITLSDLRLFKMDNLDCPSYCKVLKDGTCRVIWRDVLNNGFNKSDKTVEEYPFTNGALYINKKIDIYVRRQDPYGIWGLFSEDDTYIEGEATDFEQQDNYVKENEIEC